VLHSLPLDWFGANAQVDVDKGRPSSRVAPLSYLAVARRYLSDCVHTPVTR